MRTRQPTRQPNAVALVLLASLSLAVADIVSTDTYSCDPATCLPPACKCASNSPPGGLTPSDMPQFVLLSHDNALNQLSYDLVMKIMGTKKQRNGCNVPLTWFAMRYHSNCGPGQSALARGDEVAMQANRFDPTDPFTATDPNPNYDSRDPVTGEPSVEVEITMSRKFWNEVCKLPMRDMIGFRAQGYYNNPPIRQTLSENGWLYDSTLIERYYPNNPTSPSANQTLWPYTMDAGIPQECNFLGDEIGKCAANENYKGLWEVPLYQMQEGDTLYGISNYGDTSVPGMPAVPDMFALFKQQLDARLAGGRTPLQISTYYEWLSEEPVPPPADDPKCIMCVRSPSKNALALAKFIDYATSLPDVYFVTYSDLIRWMQDPVGKDQFQAWQNCMVPGVKADLSAVNFTAAQLADGAPASPSPPLAASPTPLPSPAPVEAPAAAPATAGVPAPSPSATADAAIPAPAPAPEGPVLVPVVEPELTPAANVLTALPSPPSAPAPTVAPNSAASASRPLAALGAAVAGLLMMLPARMY